MFGFIGTIFHLLLWFLGICIGLLSIFICLFLIRSKRRAPKRKKIHLLPPEKRRIDTYPTQRRLKIPKPLHHYSIDNNNLIIIEKDEEDEKTNRDNGEVLDVMIIGGGINGASVARQLALSNEKLRVMLIEKDDFSNGTSQGSAKLGHAGVRYLSNAMSGDWDQFGMVKEGMVGRAILKVLIPHMVKKLAFVLLNQRDEYLKLKIGLSIYDLISWMSIPFGEKGLPWNRWIKNKKIVQKVPFLNSIIGCGGIKYWEYILDDARFVMAYIMDAVRHGCYVRNYSECVGIESDKEGYVVQVLDGITKEISSYKCKMVVNATGANVYDVSNLRSNKEEKGGKVLKYKGCFIVVNKSIGDDSIAYRIRKGTKYKIIYMIPYGKNKGKTMIGTTDNFLTSVPVSVDEHWECNEIEKVMETMIHNRNNSFLVVGVDDKYNCYTIAMKEGEGKIIILHNCNLEGKMRNALRDFLILNSTGSVEILEEELEEPRFSVLKEKKAYEYFLPFGNKTFKLESDMLMENDCNRCKPSFKDIEYLLDATNLIFQGEKVTEKDVISSFCGLRSYKQERVKKDATKISRKHEIDILNDNFINVYGGKLTISYLLGCEIRDIVLEKLGVSGVKEVEHLKPLVGGYIEDVNLYCSRNYEKESKIFGDRLTKELYTHLVGFYGSEYVKVLQVIGENRDKYCEQLIEGCDHVVGEIIYQVRHCYVLKAEDFLRRRTNITLEFGEDEKVEKLVEELIRSEGKSMIGYDSCSFCTLKLPKMKICEACKDSSYCSEECLRLDSKYHRRICQKKKKRV